MKATLFFVSNDPEYIAKIKSQYETDKDCVLKIFEQSKWDQLLESDDDRHIAHVVVPKLAAGLGKSNENNVFSIKNMQPVQTMAELEAKAIESAIVKYRGNLTEAAKALGIGRATLYRKVKHFSIDPNLSRKQRVA